MENTICLNCQHEISLSYCPKCGQKASVHRYSFKHFIEHDLIHGVWHLDNGILFTVKELFTRPGHSIRGFLAGSRKGYFNYFTLLLLIVGINHYLSEFTQVKLADIMPENSKETMNIIQEFSRKNPKIILILTIPVFSVLSFFWFRKSNLNLTEHFVLNSYKTVGEFLIGLLFLIITIFYSNIGVLTVVYGIISLLTTVYGIWFYAQFFSGYAYSTKSVILRSLGIVISYIIFYGLIGFIAGIVTSVMKYRQ